MMLLDGVCKRKRCSFYIEWAWVSSESTCKVMSGVMAELFDLLNVVGKDKI